MKILVTTAYFPPHLGGSQHYIEELYSAVLNNHPDWQIDILCYNTEKVTAIEKYRGFTVYRVPAWELLRGQFALPKPWALWKLLRHLKQTTHYDVVNSHTRFFDHSWCAPWVAKYLRAKSLLTDHCASHPQHPSPIITWLNRQLDNLIIPWLGKHYDAATVVCKATGKFLHQQGFTLPAEVVYGGVKETDFQPKEKPTHLSFLPKVNLKDKTLISFVGRMTETKHPELVAASANSLLNDFPNLVCILAGGGPQKKNISQHHLDPRIICTGALQKDQVQELMQATHILVHPSTHHEGFPLTLVEAAATGCAILATDQGGTTEIIENGKTGLLIQPEVKDITEKLRDLLAHPEKRQQLGQAARKKAKEFTWKKSAQSLEKVLVSLANR